MTKENKITLYKRALEEKWRFPSKRGPLSLEEIYSLPLEGNGGLNLDAVAIEVYKRIKGPESEKVSFISDDKESRGSKEVQKLELQLEILKDRIEDVRARNDRNVELQAKAKQKAMLEKILITKEEESLKDLPADTIKKMLEEL